MRKHWGGAMNMKKRMVIILLTLVLLTGFILWQNNDLVTTRLEKTMDFETPVTVVHLSDLHTKSFGEDNARLVRHVKREGPDIIVITGDLIDQDDETLGDSLDYIGALTDTAPVYVVSGNHEHWAGLTDTVEDEVEGQGATWMDGRSLTVDVKDETIRVIGLPDPESGENLTQLFESMENGAEPTVVLSHRPVTFDWLQSHDVDMVFSGHTHGGMVRLPFFGGLYGPDQGFFPEYSAGIHHASGSSMVVSRGLGNSVFPVRIFNRPEIVTMTFK